MEDCIQMTHFVPPPKDKKKKDKDDDGGGPLPECSYSCKSREQQAAAFSDVFLAPMNS